MKRKLFAALLTTALMISCVSPAYALDYRYSGAAPGQNFYQATTVDSDYIADSGTIIVGADGTIATTADQLTSTSPLSVLNIPVGDYPDAWGEATDVAIAQNSVFPNYLAPTTQQSKSVSYLWPDPVIISNGALPTPANMRYVPYCGYYGFGYVMPKLSKGGAIARLSIPSIGVNEWVYEGTTQANMRKGVGHFSCTPAWGGNIALAGHNNPSTRAFHNLKDIKVGDKITYTTGYGTLTYVVSNVTTCATTDTSGLLQDGTHKLTLYTCKEGQPAEKLCVIATLA